MLVGASPPYAGRMEMAYSRGSMAARAGASAQVQRNIEAAQQGAEVAALLKMLIGAQHETNRLLQYLAEADHRRELRELG